MTVNRYRGVNQKWPIMVNQCGLNAVFSWKRPWQRWCHGRQIKARKKMIWCPVVQEEGGHKRDSGDQTGGQTDKKHNRETGGWRGWQNVSKQRQTHAHTLAQVLLVIGSTTGGRCCVADRQIDFTTNRGGQKGKTLYFASRRMQHTHPQTHTWWTVLSLPFLGSKM